MRMNQIFVLNREDPFEFIGEYRRDLETKNWHYYELTNGELIHFRKEYMVAVFETALKETS